MNPTNRIDAERSEIEMLLPWYVTGRLEQEDRRRVEAALGNDPELSRQLELLRDEQHAAIEGNERLGAPSSGALERLMRAVEDEAPGFSRTGAGKQGMWRKLAGFLSAPSGPAARWAGAAAVLVIIVQAVALGTLLSERSTPPGTYQTASGGNQQAAGVGTFVLARFASDVTAGAVAAHLAEKGAVIVDGPKPGGLYRIRLSREALEGRDRERAMDAFRADGRIVTFMTPTR